MTSGVETVVDTVDPRTPAEAKRHWMIDRLWSMAIGSFVLILFLILIIWLGAWPSALAERRLELLGGLAIGAMAIQIGIVWAFSLGGPVGRWEARWGNRSVSAEDDATAARRAYDGARS